MDVAASLTSKGQVTVPKAVREALELTPGDRVVFRVEKGHALLAKTPEFLSLAGSVPVPPGKQATSWDEVRLRTRAKRAAWRR